MVSRKNPLPVEEQSPDGVYYTPAWLIRLWLDHRHTRWSERIVDVGAADGRIGRAFGAIRMFDTRPMHPDVAWGDLYSVTSVAPISIVSNPVFRDARRWLLRCLELCGPSGDVSLVLPCGKLQLTSWPARPRYAVLPRHRVSFECAEEYALEANARRAAQGKGPSCHRDDSVPTGWTMGSPGDDHGIFTFEAGWDGLCETTYVDVERYLHPTQAAENFYF